MKIICERKILIHQLPVLQIGEELGQVPTEEELRRGRKHLIQNSPLLQTVPDWIAETSEFKWLVEKGVIEVVAKPA